jgi:Gram-negative porin
MKRGYLKVFWRGDMMRYQRHLPVAAMVSLASLAFAMPTAAQELTKPKEAASQSSETLIPKLRWGDDQHYLEFYGQINKGLLVFDDGGSTLGYFPVDNGNSSSRVGLRLYGAINEGWSLGGNLEWEWTPYSTNHVNQLNRDDFDWDADLLRKAEFYLESKQYGKLWLGQGSMASDTTAEVDLSGTSVVGYSLVADMAGGPFFRMTDGQLSSVEVKDAFTNFDGLGRKLRVRYDTPKFAGFSLATSVGTQVVPDETHNTVWDVAARYESTIEDYKIAGAVAYSRPDEDADDSLFDGSISILHEPTGLSLTLAAAYSDEETVDGRYGYVKLGYQTDLFEVGKTAFSVDTYFGEDIADSSTDSTSFGAQLVQNLDYYQTELYLGVRSYSYEEAVADIDDSYAVLAGARVKF